MLKFGTQIFEVNFPLHCILHRGIFVLNGYQIQAWHLTFLITLNITHKLPLVPQKLKHLLRNCYFSCSIRGVLEYVIFTNALIQSSVIQTQLFSRNCQPECRGNMRGTCCHVTCWGTKVILCRSSVLNKFSSKLAYPEIKEWGIPAKCIGSLGIWMSHWKRRTPGIIRWHQ